MFFFLFTLNFVQKISPPLKNTVSKNEKNKEEKKEISQEIKKTEQDTEKKQEIEKKISIPTQKKKIIQDISPDLFPKKPIKKNSFKGEKIEHVSKENDQNKNSFKEEKIDNISKENDQIIKQPPGKDRSFLKNKSKEKTMEKINIYSDNFQENNIMNKNKKKSKIKSKKNVIEEDVVPLPIKNQEEESIVLPTRNQEEQNENSASDYITIEQNQPPEQKKKNHSIYNAPKEKKKENIQIIIPSKDKKIAPQSLDNKTKTIIKKKSLTKEQKKSLLSLLSIIKSFQLSSFFAEELLKGSSIKDKLNQWIGERQGDLSNINLRLFEEGFSLFSPKERSLFSFLLSSHLNPFLSLGELYILQNFWSYEKYYHNLGQVKNTVNPSWKFLQRLIDLSSTINPLGNGKEYILSQEDITNIINLMYCFLKGNNQVFSQGVFIPGTQKEENSLSQGELKEYKILENIFLKNLKSFLERPLNFL